MPFERRDGYRLWVGGPVPPGSAGITIGSTVIVRRRASANVHLLRHELGHVRQWQQLGTMRFLSMYLGAYLRLRADRFAHRDAYRRIPLEIEAEWSAVRSPASPPVTGEGS